MFKMLASILHIIAFILKLQKGDRGRYPLDCLQKQLFKVSVSNLKVFFC